MFALDYSWSRPDPRQMAAAGVGLVCRYLTGDGKALDLAEVTALHAAGIAVLLNYEAESTAALGGTQAGQQAGQAARAAARALGAPVGTPIYYSIDFDVTDQMPTVLAYLTAADDPDYPARCYGSADVLDAYGRPGWQTLAWSNGRVTPRAVLYQDSIDQTFNGAAVDHNQILRAADLGAWSTNVQEDDDMKPYIIEQTDGDRAFWYVTGGKFIHCPRPAPGQIGEHDILAAADRVSATPVLRYPLARIQYLINAHHSGK